MPQAQQSPQSQRTWTPPGDEESVRIEIDPDEKDPSKAVARVKEQALSLSEDDGDSQEDPQFEQYNKRISKSVQKRLSRLSKNISRQYDQRIAEIEARHQREISDLNARVGGLNVDRGGNIDAAHEREMEALQAQLELASEKGDSKEVARITRVMSAKDAQYWAAKQAKVSTIDTRRHAQSEQRHVQQQQPVEDARLTKEAKKWIRANADWWDDPDYRGEVQMTLAIDEQLDDEGYDRETPEYFQELSRRLKEKIPTLEVEGLPPKKNGKTGNGRQRDEQDEDENRDFSPTARRAAVMSFEDRGAVPTRQRSGRVVLSKGQIATMRAMKMNPDNNEDVMTFWEESQALAASERDT